MSWACSPPVGCSFPSSGAVSSRCLGSRVRTGELERAHRLYMTSRDQTLSKNRTSANVHAQPQAQVSCRPAAHLGRWLTTKCCA